MKKLKIISIFILLTIYSSYGQSFTDSDNYDKSLVQTINELNKAGNQEEYEKVLFKLERVNELKKEKEWILLYYMAYCKTVMSRWKQDAAVKSILEEAKSDLEKAAKLSPNNSEILTLEARVYMSLIFLDIPKLGAIYTPIVLESLNKSLSIDQNNPRTYLVYGMYYIYYPKIIGGDIGKGCKSFEKAADLYTKTKHESNSISPKWGKELNEWFIEEKCK